MGTEEQHISSVLLKTETEVGGRGQRRGGDQRKGAGAHIKGLQGVKPNTSTYM